MFIYLVDSQNTPGFPDFLSNWNAARCFINLSALIKMLIDIMQSL